tara:strand:+ start:449 stop:6658 length:6210 start_codon:yes stop_codon:yes gene_type:complete
VSKDNPTQYHTRTIDLFVKSYLSGYPSLNEAADVMFSANNLENHDYFVPSFVYDIENYLEKAKIATVAGEDLERREQANIINTRSQPVKQGQKHSQEALLMFDFDDWHDCGPKGDNPNPERRRELAQRWWSWQMPTKPRESSPNRFFSAALDTTPHPTRDMNWFHSNSDFGSSNSTAPIITEMIQYMFSDGKNKVMDKAMANMGTNARMNKSKNMGEWSNSVNEASYTKQFNDGWDKYEARHKENYGDIVISPRSIREKMEDKDISEERASNILQNEAYRSLFLQHKLWELRGVPDDYIWQNLYDEQGHIDKEKTVNEMKRKSESRDSLKYRAGFWPMYFGIPLIDYEDGLKFAEWFLDGAGHIEDEDYENKTNPRFNDKTINQILGHNARGFLTRHTAVFSHALHAKYSGNVGTSGHNSLPRGWKGIAPGAEEMADNKEFRQTLMMSGRKNEDMVTGDVIKAIDQAGITREEQNKVLARLPSSEEGKTLLDVIGEGDKTPDYHVELSQENVKKVMQQFAQIHGRKGSKYANQDLLSNIRHIYKLKDYFFDPMEGLPEMTKTPLYYMTHAISGLQVAMGQEYSHWGDLVHEAFPSVFVHRAEPVHNLDDEEDSERVLPSTKNTYQSGKSYMNTTRFTNQFKMVPDDDPDKESKDNNIRMDLESSMTDADMDQHERDYLREKFNRGETVKIEFPQVVDDKQVSEEEYMLEQLPEGMSLDEYVGGYEQDTLPVTAGQSGLITPLLPHTDVGNPNHFSPDMQHDQTIENENTPASTIQSMSAARKQSDNIGGINTSRKERKKGGNRRVSDSTFSRDIKAIEGGKGTKGEEGYKRGTSKQSIHSSMITTDESRNRALMLHTLLFQAHHGIDNYSEEDHETHNSKQTIPHTVYTSNHRDPLGRGEGAGTLYQNELLTADQEDNPFDAKIAVYDKDDYEQAMNRYKNGGILRLPTPIRNNIVDRRELVEQLEKIHQDSTGTTFNELDRTARKKLRNEMKQKSNFEGYYQKDDEQRQYMIGYNPQSQYQEALIEYRQLARIAHNDGDIEDGVNFDMLATEQGQHIRDDLGELPPVTKHELRKNYLEDAKEMHQQAVAASQIMKPLMKWANPDLYQTHTPELNNQAWADTKTLAHLCESWMRTLSPKERENWIKTAKVSHSRDGVPTQKSVMKILREHFKSQGMGKDSIGRRIESMIKDVTKPVSRLTWQGGNIDKNIDLGEDKSVMNLLQKYVDGDLDSNHYPPHDNNELVRKIFNEVNKVLPNNATSQDFADALHARYIPHSAKEDTDETDENGETITTGGINLMEMLPAESMYKFGQGRGGTGHVYNYKKTKGGHHHEAELNENTPLMSGGEGTKRESRANKAGGVEDYSMYAEIHALNKVYRELLKVSRGSANGVAKTPHKTAPLKNAKGDEGLKNLTERMGNFIERLKDDVISVEDEAGEINTRHQKVGTGGLGVNEIQLPAVHTCPEANTKFGHVTRPLNKITTHGLRLNRLVVHDNKGDFHQGGFTMKGHLDPYAMRDFHPELLPYDMSADGNTQFPPVAMQPSGIPGESVNSNLPVFDNVGNAQNLLRSEIETLDCLTDDTLIYKKDGRPVPIKSMHRIFDLSDLKHLRGFSGDWIASHMPKGEPVILQKKGKRLKAYNADMKLVELTDDMNEEKDKVNDKDFVVHAILDEEKIYFVDLLEAADEKTHNMPAKDRVRHLRAHFESSEHIKMPEPFNTKRADDEGLEEAIHLLREESSCDILLRDASTTYMRGEIRHPKWVLLSKEKKVDVIILDRKGMNYRIGVGPIMHPEHYGSRSVELEGEHYMDVGSAKGPRGYDKGEYISVFCTGVSKSGDENPTYKIRSARIDRDAHPQATDSVETLAMMISDSKIPHRVRLNKGHIHILFPSLDDEVIYKVNEEENGWMVEPEKTLWGHGEDYFIKLSEDMRPHWTPLATLLLKKDKDKREVKPEVPAGHTKKRKHILPEEEEIIKRGLEVVERGLEQLSKEKITFTGVEGLGIDYAGADVESPRGPTSNMNDDTMPDYDPSSRDYNEKPPTSRNKKTRVRTTEGEEGITDNRGNLTITEPRV